MGDEPKKSEVLKALEVLKKYCKDRVCDECVFTETCCSIYADCPGDWKHMYE
jgi:hypothetical protein